MTNLWRLTFLTLLVGITKGQWSDNPYAGCCDNYCYREDENPYLMFGTKTSYEFVYGKASNQHIVPHCRAVMFWSFNRHGTRLPSRSNIHELQKLQKIKEEIVKNYEMRGSYPENGKLCDADIDLFKRWQWNFTISDHNANSLTDQGRDNIRFLARRWQTRYPELLRPPFSDQSFKFRYTDTERTRESFEAYAQGLFAQEAYKVHGTSAPNDTILNAYDNCPAWKSKTEDPESQRELNEFKERDEYKRLVAHVSRRLAFRYTLNDTLIEAMYDMCRFDKAWQVGRPSAWCAAFTKEQLLLLEYAHDLKYYFKSGYGLDMNPKLGCFPMRDMMTKFDKFIRGERQQPKAMVYFTHSAALQQLITALGVKKDNLPLTADNMKEQNRRQWRTSQMSPFAANLVSVLYECTREEKHRVMFFLNEKPLDYPGCSVGLCSWEYIRRELSDAAENCDFEFCYHSSANIAQISNLVIITTIILTSLKSLSLF